MKTVTILRLQKLEADFGRTGVEIGEVCLKGDASSGRSVGKANYTQDCKISGRRRKKA